MNTAAKTVESLQVSDFLRHPVWEFINDDRIGETAVRPVEQLPVSHLKCGLVGVQVTLANASRVWALIGNVDVGNPRATEHFLTLSVEKNGQWFCLARYHDLDYPDRGPEALARFLGLPASEVFPITYDLRPYAEGNLAALMGEIRSEPREKLTEAELIDMALRLTMT
jgi:hypothetical protein